MEHLASTPKSATSLAFLPLSVRNPLILSMGFNQLLWNKTPVKGESGGLLPARLVRLSYFQVPF